MLNPDIILFDNSYVIAWDEYTNSRPEVRNVYIEHLSFDGTKIGDTSLVNNPSSIYQKRPTICGFKNGNFVVVWETLGSDKVEDIYGQLFDGNGQRIGAEFVVNTNQTNVQINPALSCLDNGYFVVAWQSYGQDGSVEGVYAQAFSNKAQKLGYEILINDQTYNAQSHPVVTTLKNQDTVFAWQSHKQNSSSYNIFYKQVKFVHPITPTESQSITNTQELSSTKTSSTSRSVSVTTSSARTLSDSNSITKTLSASKSIADTISNSDTLSSSQSTSKIISTSISDSASTTQSGTHSSTDACPRKMLLQTKQNFTQPGNITTDSRIAYFSNKSIIMISNVVTLFNVKIIVQTFDQAFQHLTPRRELISNPYLGSIHLGVFGDDSFITSWSVLNTTTQTYSINVEIYDKYYQLVHSTVVGQFSQQRKGIFRMSTYTDGYSIATMTSRESIQIMQFDQYNTTAQHIINKYLCNSFTAFDIWSNSTVNKLVWSHFDSQGIYVSTYVNGVEQNTQSIVANANHITINGNNEGKFIVAWQEYSNCALLHTSSIAEIFYNDGTSGRVYINNVSTPGANLQAVRFVDSDYYIATFLTTNQLQLRLFYKDIFITSYTSEHNNGQYVYVAPIINKEDYPLALECNKASVLLSYAEFGQVKGLVLNITYKVQEIITQDQARYAEVMEIPNTIKVANNAIVDITNSNNMQHEIMNINGMTPNTEFEGN